MKFSNQIVDLSDTEFVYELEIFHCEIKYFPKKCKGLYIEDCKIDILPTLPVDLETLMLYDCEFSKLEYLPDSLKELEIKFRGDIESLPTLPPNLIKLECTHTKIKSLPDLPPSLLELKCNNNNLTHLPTLPSNLNLLYCDNNKIDELPQLPQTLTNLRCNNNLLTVLPELLQGLKELHCNDNPLIALPYLPRSLDYRLCDFENMFDKHDLLRYIEIHNEIDELKVTSYINKIELERDDAIRKNKEYERLRELDLGSLLYHAGKKYI